MARRIGLAQALINDPDLLMLDEPTTGLDPIGTRQIKDLILELAKRGKTVLLCSHLLADVEDVCDRIAILYGGKIHSQGRVKDLLQLTDKKQITTGSLSIAALEKIKKIVLQEQSECVITSPMDRLETFFIKTVAEAQLLSSPTSGAVSTTHIGDFLAAKTTTQSILDKLVTAPVSPDVPSELPETKQVVPVDDSESKPDEQLLDKLTGRPEPVVVTKPVEDHNIKEPEQIKKGVLDRLADRPTIQENDKDRTDTNKGDSTDA
jgi:ABC-2 type transport system ATP-binding protein